MKVYLLIALGSGLGGMMRYWLSNLVPSRSGFPWGTFLVNVLGSALIGWIASLPEDRISFSSRIFLTVGVMGGFTTFSAFSLQTVALFQAGKSAVALLYVGLSVAACVLGCWSGSWLGRVR